MIAMRAVCAAGLLVLVLALSPRPAALQRPVDDPLPQRVQVVLRTLLPDSGAPPELAAGGRTFRASADLPCFYERRGFAPAWSDGGGLLPRANELAAALAAAGEHGLRPEDYPAAEIRRPIPALPVGRVPAAGSGVSSGSSKLGMGSGGGSGCLARLRSGPRAGEPLRSRWGSSGRSKSRGSSGASSSCLIIAGGGA